MNVFNLISAGGGSGSGLYIWEKSLNVWNVKEEHMADNTMVDSTTNTKRTIYYSNEITRDGDVVSLVNPQSIQMSHSSQSALPYNVYIDKDVYYIPDSPSGKYYFTCPQLYEYGTQNTKGSFFINSSNYILYIRGNWLGDARTIVSKNHYELEKEFIGYVVSDKEDAYPDGAVHDGYYYERYKGIPLENINALEFETGTITSASGYPTSITVNHSLSSAPTKAFLIAETMPSRGEDWLRGAMISPAGISSSNSFIYKSGRGIGNTGRGASNSTTVTFNTDTTYTFGAGVTYRYILFAGNYYPM